MHTAPAAASFTSRVAVARIVLLLLQQVPLVKTCRSCNMVLRRCPLKMRALVSPKTRCNRAQRTWRHRLSHRVNQPCAGEDAASSRPTSAWALLRNSIKPFETSRLGLEPIAAVIALCATTIAQAGTICPVNAHTAQGAQDLWWRMATKRRTTLLSPLMDGNEEDTIATTTLTNASVDEIPA